MANKAILAGINNFLHISDLRGCINDVVNMASLLTEVCGFSAENIRVCKDSEVTKERLTQEWQWLLDDAQPGDRLVFHMSSHGSFTDDVSGDESDGVDELICLYDMDWNDPDTYLLDDDLGRLTALAPPGVSLTLIFDLCHAGTATRLLVAPGAKRAFSAAKPPLVDLSVSANRLGARGSERGAAGEMSLADRVLSPSSADEARDAVLARFVEPPPEVLARLHTRGVRRSIRGAMSTRSSEADMNHVLLAGSEATQTCADAYIGASFQGAFTNALVATVRDAGREIDYQDLIRSLRAKLSQDGFTQNPQLEPESVRGSLFAHLVRGNSGESAPPKLDLLGFESQLAELTSAIRDVRDLLTGQLGPAGARSRAASRAIVFIHGICRHTADFADSWWEAIRPHLSSSVRSALESNRHPIVWSDLVTRERALAIDREAQKNQQELATKLREVLEDRAQREALIAAPKLAEDETPAANRAVRDRAFLGIPGVDCIDDFVKYFVLGETRSAVKGRLLSVLVPLLQAGVRVELIAHSFGTVVAYEALHELDQSLPGRVTNLFTVGSALSIVPVQNQVRPGGGGRPRCVERWINLDAQGDVVGGPLDAAFEVTDEFLRLHPTGCRGLFGRHTPSCAHSSYFARDNRAVNRDIFARFMNG